MKKKYQAILSILITLFILWIYFFSNWDQILVNLIILNVIIYILRFVFIRLVNLVLKRRIYIVVISASFNIVWIFFIFWLLFLISSDLVVSLVAFLVVGISLTLKNIINNIASGAILLATEPFDVGDLIETNEVQGIVNEVSLNYTKIKEFDGVITYIPNQDVLNKSLKKFTYRKLKPIERLMDEETQTKKKKYKKYLKNIDKLLLREEKITKYTKTVEILTKIDPNILENLLSPVFDKYEKIFGIRPEYVIETTGFRCIVTFYLMAKRPLLILQYTDNFLKECIFQLYYDDVFDGWESYKENELKLKSKGEAK